MLQSDLDHPVGFLCRGQALFRFWNRPGHGFFGIEVLACRKRIHKMSRMDVQRTRNYDSVDVLPFKQAAMIVKGLNSGCQLLCFVATPGVDIGDCDELCLGNFKDLLQQVLPATAHTDHAYADAVVGAEHARGWIDQKSCSPQSSLFHEITPGVISHFPVPLLCKSDFIRLPCV